MMLIANSIRLAGSARVFTCQAVPGVRGIPREGGNVECRTRAPPGSGAAAGRDSGSGPDLPRVHRDSAEAVYWYALAGAEGNAHALTNLGTLMVGGQGVPNRDGVSAAILWHAAAARGGIRRRDLQCGLF